MSYNWSGSLPGPDEQDPAVPPITVPTRTARSGSGHRVYTGGDLLGYVDTFRTTNGGGRKCTRWRAKAAAMAFLAPGCPLTGVPRYLHQPVPDSEFLPGEHTTMTGAIRALVAYLVDKQAPAVGFGPHPDVASPTRGATRRPGQASS